EGAYTSGQRVLVIEDLISTGKSSLQVVDVLKQAGVQIEGMVSIFNYGFDKAVQDFAAANVRTKSLTNYPTLIELAIEKGLIEADVKETLMAWST
ncbi:orotate phosphoribosyltransferase, partial [Glaesserella parasuis]|uniref:orotate phosphoribosyltransferase n=1 Tax=Glaesserella parasuis TaxID=738 RepID=UPI003F2FDC22